MIRPSSAIWASGEPLVWIIVNLSSRLATKANGCIYMFKLLGIFTKPPSKNLLILKAAYSWLLMKPGSFWALGQYSKPLWVFRHSAQLLKKGAWRLHLIGNKAPPTECNSNELAHVRNRCCYLHTGKRDPNLWLSSLPCSWIKTVALVPKFSKR